LQIKKWYVALTAGSAIATLAFTCLALAVWKSIPADAFEVSPIPYIHLYASTPLTRSR
jgi:hypothetical protein